MTSWQQGLPVGHCSLQILFLHSAPSWAPEPARENRESGSHCLRVLFALIPQLGVGTKVHPPCFGACLGAGKDLSEPH